MSVLWFSETPEDNRVPEDGQAPRDSGCRGLFLSTVPVREPFPNSTHNHPALLSHYRDEKTEALGRFVQGHTDSKALGSLKKQSFSSCLRTPCSKVTAQTPTVPSGRGRSGAVGTASAVDAEGGGTDIVGPDLLFFVKREPENARFLHGGSAVRTNSKTHGGDFGAAGSGRKGLHWFGPLSRWDVGSD